MTTSTQDPAPQTQPGQQNDTTTLPVAIVGLNFGRHIINQICEGGAGDHVHIVAVCDLDAEKSQQMGRKLGVPSYTSLDALLACDDIPAIGLFTGPNGRAGLLHQIMDAGKDVMTTKPFERDCAAAYEVLTRARSIGRIIHLNSPAPCLPLDLNTITTWRQKHQLGRPVSAHLTTYARYQEQADGSWQDDPMACPVAPIFRLGIYLINDLIRLLGEAESVSVISSRVFTGRPTPDNGQLSILFKNGAVATIMCSFCIEDGDHYRNAMTLNFERGTIYRNVGPRRTTSAGDGKTELALVMGSGSTPRQIIEDEIVTETSGAYQWQAFADAVRGHQITDATTPEIIVAGLRVIDAMVEAEQTSRTVKVEPVR